VTQPESRVVTNRTPEAHFASCLADSEGTAPISDARLEISVLYTDIPATLAALRTAAQLAQGLHACIRLLVLQCVPFPLPLDHPAVDVRFLGRRFRTLAQTCGLESRCLPVDTIVDIQLCREPAETLCRQLKPKSVIVIGKRTRWWPRSEDWLARKLRRAGHHVVRTTFRKELVHA
jgi:hypothetical protein